MVFPHRLMRPSRPRPLLLWIPGHNECGGGCLGEQEIAGGLRHEEISPCRSVVLSMQLTSLRACVGQSFSVK